MQKYKKAFSLIEISVVFLVIGILIAGISQGMDLYSDMRLTSARKITQNSRVARVPDLILWLETTSNESFLDSETKDGGKISVWNDINPTSISKLKFSNLNAEHQPIYSASGIGGIPSVSFNDKKYIEASNFNIGANYTIFIVFNATKKNTESATIFSIFNNSLQHGILIAIHNDTTSPIMIMRALHRSPMGSTTENNSYTNTNSPISLNKNYVFSYGRNIANNESNFYLNNINLNGVNSGASASEFDSKNLGMVIGRLLPANIRRWFEGNISEIIIYNRYLNANEFNDVNSYLFKKFNLNK